PRTLRPPSSPARTGHLSRNTEGIPVAGSIPVVPAGDTGVTIEVRAGCAYGRRDAPSTHGKRATHAPLTRCPPPPDHHGVRRGRSGPRVRRGQRPGDAGAGGSHRGCGPAHAGGPAR